MHGDFKEKDGVGGKVMNAKRFLINRKEIMKVHTKSTICPPIIAATGVSTRKKRYGCN